MVFVSPRGDLVRVLCRSGSPNREGPDTTSLRNEFCKPRRLWTAHHQGTRCQKPYELWWLGCNSLILRYLDPLRKFAWSKGWRQFLLSLLLVAGGQDLRCSYTPNAALWEHQKVEPPKFRGEYSYLVDYKTLRGIYFLDPPRGI